MKKYLFLLGAAIMSLASCTKSDEVDSVSDGMLQVEIGIQTDVAESTRAVGDYRYVLEAYYDAACTEPAAIFDDGGVDSYRVETPYTRQWINISSSKEYHILFWADRGEESGYDVSDLKCVTLGDGYEVAEAWQQYVTLSNCVDGYAFNITLQRATAKVNFIESDEFVSSTLDVDYNEFRAYNVLKSDVTGETYPASQSYQYDQNVSEGITPEQLNTEDLYILAPRTSAAVMDFTFSDFEGSFEVTNVPVQGNYITNISGHYTSLFETYFNFYLEEEWSSTDVETPTETSYQVGDVYYNELTHEAMGIVFATENSSDMASAASSAIIYVVSFDESDEMAWMNNSNFDSIGASDLSNGANNQAAAVVAGIESYLPFAYAATFGEGWYLPAIDELTMLAASVESVNEALVANGGTALSTEVWSSSEVVDRANMAYTYDFSTSSSTSRGKGATYATRAINKIVAGVVTPSTAYYTIGDIISNLNGEQVGIVYSVDGDDAMILSLTESTAAVKWSNNFDLIGASSTTDGSANMAAAEAYSLGLSDFPSFTFAEQIGDGWYVPSVEELEYIFDNKYLVNNTLTREGTIVANELWSSTESASNRAYSVSDSETASSGKGATCYVRAIRKITKGEVLAPYSYYKIGEVISNSAGEEVGVVFSANGDDATIISIAESATAVDWSNDFVLYSIDDVNDGAVNQALALAVSSDLSNFPSFAFAAELGEGWYLPSIAELVSLNTAKSLVDLELTNELWSSTESSSTRAYSYEFANDATDTPGKGVNLYVRAARKITKGEVIQAPITEYAVGDLYPNATNPIGVVYYIEDDEDDMEDLTGIIVSLDEAELTWCPELDRDYTGKNSSLYGASNMLTIYSSTSGTFEGYPAMEWVHAKNASDVVYAKNQLDIWYLPAINELHAINGTSTTDEVKQVINVTLKQIGATLFGENEGDRYWSSTINGSSGCAQSRTVLNGDDFTLGTPSQDEINKVRAIMRFKL